MVEPDGTVDDKEAAALELPAVLHDFIVRPATRWRT